VLVSSAPEMNKYKILKFKCELLLKGTLDNLKTSGREPTQNIMTYDCQIKVVDNVK
jgi:hypothetical protein